jgi:hypothetical protein
VPTTIRSAVTKLQNLGERVTGIALNAADAQNLDMLRWTSGDGGFLTGGYATDNRQQTFGSSDNIFGGPDAQRIISPNVPAGICLLVHRAWGRSIATPTGTSVSTSATTSPTPA